MSDSTSDLLDGYLDGSLTPEQGELLQQLLRDDSEARVVLRRRATIDEGLVDLATAESVANQSRLGEGYYSTRFNSHSDRNYGKAYKAWSPGRCT